MKIILYILLAIIVVIGGAVAWFLYSFKTVDKLSIPASATKAERLEMIDGYLAALHKKGDFNGGLLFAEKGEPLLSSVYGYTDHTKEKKLSIRSSFRLASVSKQFTAAGILRAAELGLLELDTPVISYIKSQHQGVTQKRRRCWSCWIILPISSLTESSPKSPKP